MILVTGAAGFIGMHVTRALLERGATVVGLDNLNDYYDPALKQARLDHIGAHPNFHFIKADIADANALTALFSEHKPEQVVHLAAQAGVRYSLENPQAYIQSNLVGFANLLECCRHHPVAHLVYASSSSVYGANKKLPFAETDNVDHPVSLYAATKKANELMAHSYSQLYGIPATGLRFFTVYGPWGRPDMSPWLFTSAILEGRPLKVFNEGNMERDFTYIDDIVEGVLRVLDQPPDTADTGGHEVRPYNTIDSADTPISDSAVGADLASARPSGVNRPTGGREARPYNEPEPGAPHRLYNIGNNRPVKLLDYIRTIEAATGKQAILDLQPMQPGDVPATFADISAIEAATGFRPHTPLSEGITYWVTWYRAYTAS